VAELVERLQSWEAATRETAAALQAERQEAGAQAKMLESPAAIAEYIDFFLGFFSRAVDEVARVTAELAEGPRQDHVDSLRQLASNAAVEGRRCGVFRDKWINRTLPYEQVRPMLNRVSNLSRDRLAAHRDLGAAADGLLQIIGPPAHPPAPGEALDRRALFNRILKRDGR
jgi:hypothetical protein